MLDFVHSSQLSQSLLFMHHFCETSACPYLLQHRQGPNFKLLGDATEGPAKDTWFEHRSESPLLTFSRLEFSLNEHDAAPTDLQQPSVGLLLMRAGGPSQLLQLRQA